MGWVFSRLAARTLSTTSASDNAAVRVWQLNWILARIASRLPGLGIASLPLPDPHDVPSELELRLTEDPERGPLIASWEPVRDWRAFLRDRPEFRDRPHAWEADALFITVEGFLRTIEVEPALATALAIGPRGERVFLRLPDPLPREKTNCSGALRKGLIGGIVGTASVLLASVAALWPTTPEPSGYAYVAGGSWRSLPNAFWHERPIPLIDVEAVATETVAGSIQTGGQLCPDLSELVAELNHVLSINSDLRLTCPSADNGSLGVVHIYHAGSGLAWDLMLSEDQHDAPRRGALVVRVSLPEWVRGAPEDYHTGSLSRAVTELRRRIDEALPKAVERLRNANPSWKGFRIRGDACQIEPAA